MPTRNINLTDHYDRFVEKQVEAGKYQNASEVLRAELRLLEHQTDADEHKLALLKKLAADGFESLDQGEGRDLADEIPLGEAITRIGRRAAKLAAARSGK